MKANDIQFGGNHYNKFGKLQHWDYVGRNGLDYFLGCATKYVFRWRDKKGVEDLKKGRHFVVKYIELIEEGMMSARPTRDPLLIEELGERLRDGYMNYGQVIIAFRLDYWQGAVVSAVQDWQCTGAMAHLHRAVDILNDYISIAESETEADAWVTSAIWDRKRGGIESEGSNALPADDAPASAAVPAGGSVAQGRPL
jgi:hypothetical protein